DGFCHVLSMTKPVGVAAVLMMIEQGKVRLQDPISKFVPEWRDVTVGIPMAVATGVQGGGPAGGAAPADPRYYTVPANRELTVRDLLSHTSGILVGPISNFAGRAVWYGPSDTLASFV